MWWRSSLHVGRGGPWRWRPRWGWNHSSAGCTSETPPSHTTGTSLKMTLVFKSVVQLNVSFALLTPVCHLIERRSAVSRLIWVSLSDAISPSLWCVPLLVFKIRGAKITLVCDNLDRRLELPSSLFICFFVFFCVKQICKKRYKAPWASCCYLFSIFANLCCLG